MLCIVFKSLAFLVSFFLPSGMCISWAGSGSSFSVSSAASGLVPLVLNKYVLNGTELTWDWSWFFWDSSQLHVQKKQLQSLLKCRSLKFWVKSSWENSRNLHFQPTNQPMILKHGWICAFFPSLFCDKIYLWDSWPRWQGSLSSQSMPRGWDHTGLDTRVLVSLTKFSDWLWGKESKASVRCHPHQTPPLLELRSFFRSREGGTNKGFLPIEINVKVIPSKSS